MSRPSSTCHCGKQRFVKDHGTWYGYYCPHCHDGGSANSKGKGGNVHKSFSKTQGYTRQPSIPTQAAKPVLDASEQFFTSYEERARLQSQPNFLSEGDDRFFCSVIDDNTYGFKAIEIFQNEITANLVAYAISNNTILYRTQKYWYKFTLNTEHNVIEMACFEIGSGRRWDSWMNKHSCSVGGDFLKNHADKRVNTTAIVL